MRAQIILGDVAQHLHRLSPDIQRVLLLFGQIQQPSPRRFFVLVACNQDGGLLLWSKTRREPGAGSAREHTAAADDARWRSREYPLAFPLIAHKGHG